jgi:hypothetical protein
LGLPILPHILLKPILKDEWLRLGGVNNGMRAFHKELGAINNVDTPLLCKMEENIFYST